MSSNLNKVSPEGSEFYPTAKKHTYDSSIDSKLKVTQFLDGKGMSVTMGILTCYALFGDDIRLISFAKSADNFFFTASLLALLSFTMELILNCYSKVDYFGGFYFILDFVSTISLIPDIGWIWDPLTSGDDADRTAALKAGRASRAGTKAGRIVRIVRLVRMVRIVKLYKMKTQGKEVATEISEPSKVGKMLTELTTRRLIVLVLVMIIALPLIDGSLNQDYNEYQEIGLQKLHRFPQDYNVTGKISQSEFRDMIYIYSRNSGNLLNLSITSVNYLTMNRWLKDMRFQPVDPNDGSQWLASAPYTLSINYKNNWEFSKMKDNIAQNYRSSEFTVISADGCFKDGKCTDCNVSGTDCSSSAYFDTTAKSRSDAGVNIIKTLFLMVILSAGAIMFTRDAQTLVIGPIERMMDLVNKLAENPLSSAKIQKREYDEDQPKGDYETSMLEETLQKIGGLLQVGFGAAGTEIIAKNMGGTGELNVMIPGKKITSIFGFGIIERFTETCSALEENIITYINSVAEIVHSDTNSYYGAANKNIGSAFLLAWKICDGSLPGLRDPRDDANKVSITDIEKQKKREGIYSLSAGDGTQMRKIYPQELVDSALTAVLKMRVDIYNSNTQSGGKLRKFCASQSIVKTFGDHFEVHLGFGLHIGWAIEGAIGSKYKIDASYLSPNVNMAARLEAATGQFHVPMLISEWFVGEMSHSAKKLCRKIDRVTVKGSEIPMELWTFDIGNYPAEGFSPMISEDGEQVPVDFERDQIYRTLQQKIPKEFFADFDQGVKHYLDGEWGLAGEKFRQCKELYDDGPTTLLLEVLGRNQNTAPSDWKGFRPLTEK